MARQTPQRGAGQKGLRVSADDDFWSHPSPRLRRPMFWTRQRSSSVSSIEISIMDTVLVNDLHDAGHRSGLVHRTMVYYMAASLDSHKAACIGLLPSLECRRVASVLQGIQLRRSVLVSMLSRLDFIFSFPLLSYHCGHACCTGSPKVEEDPQEGSGEEDRSMQSLNP